MRFLRTCICVVYVVCLSVDHICIHAQPFPTPSPFIPLRVHSSAASNHNSHQPGLHLNDDELRGGDFSPSCWLARARDLTVRARRPAARWPLTLLVGGVCECVCVCECLCVCVCVRMCGVCARHQRASIRTYQVGGVAATAARRLQIKLVCTTLAQPASSERLHASTPPPPPPPTLRPRPAHAGRVFYE